MLQFISDIHLEFYEDKVNINNFITPCSPYLAILGDLGCPHNDNFAEFLQQVSKSYEKVFFVSGNHEYYSTLTFDEIEDKIVEICKRYGNIFYLNNEEYKLNDNIVILGTSLWSYIPDNKKQKIKNSINDYNKIFIKENHYKKNITVDFTNELHQRSILWLNEKINQYSDKNVIILTHHLPSFRLIDPRYEGSDINFAFASDLEYLMKDNVKYWLCGHTHFPCKIKINQCQCIINPIGYPGENEIKDEQKVICIE